MAFHQSPSQILNIRNPWLAYQMDESVLYFGKWVESKLNERDSKGKPKWTVAEIFEGTRSVSVTQLMMATGADTMDI